MTEDEKKEFIYKRLEDLYHEFNHAVNYLVIIREFWQDLLNVKQDKEVNYETISSLEIDK